MTIKHDRGLSPVPCARRTEPTKSLADGCEYVGRLATNIQARFDAIRAAQQQQAAAPNVSPIKRTKSQPKGL